MTHLAPLLLAALCSAPARATPTAYGVPSGDPYTDGYPSSAERELHLWTNAVRVDPEAFRDAYASGGCSFDSFSSTEQSPHDPTYLSMGLAEAARYHSTDMDATGNFSHSSSDGTSFSERVGWFYSGGMIGENIAWNYGSPWNTVMTGWMCSSGHRANIMTDYTELGTGIVGDYYTQDFGGGAVATYSPVAMGAHSPQDVSSSADFMTDWLEDDAPVRLTVVVDAVVTDLTLLYGTETRGIFGATVALDAVDCHEYYFSWESADGWEGSFPEEGSYTFGDGCTDAIGWIPDQSGPTGGTGGLPGGGQGGEGLGGGDGGGAGDGAPSLGDPRLIGCSSAPVAAGLGWLVGLLAVRRRSTGQGQGPGRVKTCGRSAG